jgi:hypothetical protein
MRFGTDLLAPSASRNGLGARRRLAMRMGDRQRVRERRQVAYGRRTHTVDHEQDGRAGSDDVNGDGRNGDGRRRRRIEEGHGGKVDHIGLRVFTDAIERRDDAGRRPEEEGAEMR